MNFNYTKVYKDIYGVIKKDNIPHEDAHKAAIKITEAVLDIYMFTEQYPSGLTDIINYKFGGIDLDDKGQPIGFGINATGLNNSK